MGIGLRHVLWCSATLSLGAFFYVLTLEPMDETRMPRAAALDRTPPRSTLILHTRHSLALGQSIAADRQSLELLLQHPEDLAAVYYRALVLRSLGQDEEALEHWVLLERLTNGLESWPRRYTTSEIDYYRAWALTGVGRDDEARVLFRGIADELERSASDAEGEIASPIAQYNLACYRSMAGQHEPAMDHFSRSVELGYGRVEGERGWWLVDPDLEGLHGDDRFWIIGSRMLDDDGRSDRERGDRGAPPDGGG